MLGLDKLAASWQGAKPGTRQAALRGLSELAGSLGQGGELVPIGAGFMMYRPPSLGQALGRGGQAMLGALADSEGRETEKADALEMLREQLGIRSAAEIEHARSMAPFERERKLADLAALGPAERAQKLADLAALGPAERAQKLADLEAFAGPARQIRVQEARALGRVRLDVEDEALRRQGPERNRLALERARGLQDLELSALPRTMGIRDDFARLAEERNFGRQQHMLDRTQNFQREMATEDERRRGQERAQDLDFFGKKIKLQDISAREREDREFQRQSEALPKEVQNAMWAMQLDPNDPASRKLFLQAMRANNLANSNWFTRALFGGGQD